MPNVFLIFSFVFGIIIGSFLNVVALRFNSGMTLKGRSECFSCGKNLAWHELIPVFSFIFQNGKCKQCKSRISWQYPIVEIVAGIVFILIFYFYPPVSLGSAVNTIFYLIISCLLLIISIYDIKHKIIPNEWVYTFSTLAFIKLFVTSDLSFVIPTTTDLLSGPILALPFLLMSVFSSGRWMGYADSKLVLGIGWTLGLLPGLSAIILSFWMGAAIGLMIMYVKHGKYKNKYEIPFGPYLIAGMYIVLFTGIRVLEL